MLPHSLDTECQLSSTISSWSESPAVQRSGVHGGVSCTTKIPMSPGRKMIKIDIDKHLPSLTLKGYHVDSMVSVSVPMSHFNLQEHNQTNNGWSKNNLCAVGALRELVGVAPWARGRWPVCPVGRAPSHRFARRCSRRRPRRLQTWSQRRQSGAGPRNGRPVRPATLQGLVHLVQGLLGLDRLHYRSPRLGFPTWFVVGEWLWCLVRCQSYAAQLRATADGSPYLRCGRRAQDRTCTWWSATVVGDTKMWCYPVTMELSGKFWPAFKFSTLIKQDSHGFSYPIWSRLVFSEFPRTTVPKAHGLMVCTIRDEDGEERGTRSSLWMSIPLTKR